MADTCAICLEDMDMKTFEDEKNSTETCVKLECKHAFHTRCIITCLSTQDKQCPQCNTPKTVEDELSGQGLMKITVHRFKKQPQVKSLLNELKTSKKEYAGLLKNLRDQTRKFIKEKVKELNINVHRKYFIKCLQKMRKMVKEEAIRLGPLYVGILESDRAWRSRYGGSSVEKMLYGSSSWTFWRLKNPKLRINLI